jgi:hypothetical protein
VLLGAGELGLRLPERVEVAVGAERRKLMALFKRKEGSKSLLAADAAPRSPESATISEVDWSDPANICAEWPQNQFDLDQDRLAWRNGMRMADQDEFPAQRFNEAEYMTRALRHHLYGSGPLSDVEVLISSQRVLHLLDLYTSAPYPDWADQFIPKIRRLPLAIIRQRSWQAEHLGGNGTAQIDLESPGIIRAIACVQAPNGRYLEHFFRVA